jgi:hypothetical protein
MAVNKDRLFGFVVSDPPQDSRGKLQVLTLHCVGTELHSFSLNTILSQLRFQERSHTKDIFTIDRIPRYACLNQRRVPPMLSDLVDT